MKVVFLTAGAAGMYCGSCMHDNALAAAMRADGVDCILQPVYTPIRTDAPSIADQRVFFGGIQIYLLQKAPWLRHVPGPLRRFLDWPPLIRWATKNAGSTDAAQLGALSVSMLQGANGRQASEVDRLVDWLAEHERPDALLLSNLLIGGALPKLRECLPETKIGVILQGDDIFLEHLPEPFQEQATAICQSLIEYVDHVIVHSQFYADKMGQMLAIPDDKIEITPLSIDLSPFECDEAPKNKPASFRLGYFARIAKEKGLHNLVDAFIALANEPKHADLTLHAAGWLGNANEPYLEELRERISAAGLLDRFTYHGSPDAAEKVAFLKSLDLLSVPTEYHEPKGLFVLESIAAGVPVVQPDHGAFGELIESTQGGVTVAPSDTAALAEAIDRLKDSPERRQQLASEGAVNVREKHSIKVAAERMRQLLEP